MERKKKIGEKVTKVWAHQNNTYLEYCVMESLYRKIQFMI
jgi:hypothetical protein